MLNNRHVIIAVFLAAVSLAPALAAERFPTASVNASAAAAPQAEPTLTLVQAQRMTAMVSNGTGYQLGSGDRVHIIVFGQNDLTGDYQVDGSGMLQFPLIGSVHAGGMTAGELQQAITSKLTPGYLRNPSVSVEVINYRPFSILGEVNKPGAFPYVSGMTVFDAVALAGGFTYRAKDNDYSIRRSESGQRVELHANGDTPVNPGDVIIVPERFF
ncbi:MAG TPA: polysaccharide biosynthesis/export family protein [Stellaceae bacterium]|nr:polysaccharide biosynthesis/export family protein [Stellaceae bacterium]